MKDKNSDNEMMYMPIGMCIGLSLGVALGTAMDNIPVWMCIGLSIGMCFGTALDAKKKNKQEPSEETEEKISE